MADSSDGYWVERAQSAEARLNTLKGAYEPALEKVQQFKTAFGVRERSDGTIDVDFDQFVERLGVEQCIQLRCIIDEKYGIRGAPGEKPKIRVASGTSKVVANG